jgi:hypothetical protein
VFLQNIEKVANGEIRLIPGPCPLSRRRYLIYFISPFALEKAIHREKCLLNFKSIGL